MGHQLCVRGETVVLPCLNLFVREAFEVGRAGIPHMEQDLEFDARAHIARVAECLERPILHSDMVFCSDELIKPAVGRASMRYSSYCCYGLHV